MNSTWFPCRFLILLLLCSHQCLLCIIVYGSQLTTVLRGREGSRGRTFQSTTFHPPKGQAPRPASSALKEIPIHLALMDPLGLGSCFYFQLRRFNPIWSRNCNFMHFLPSFIFPRTITIRRINCNAQRDDKDFCNFRWSVKSMERASRPATVLVHWPGHPAPKSGGMPWLLSPT